MPGEDDGDVEQVAGDEARPAPDSVLEQEAVGVAERAGEAPDENTSFSAFLLAPFYAPEEGEEGQRPANGLQWRLDGLSHGR